MLHYIDVCALFIREYKIDVTAIKRNKREYLKDPNETEPIGVGRGFFHRELRSIQIEKHSLTLIYLEMEPAFALCFGYHH